MKGVLLTIGLILFAAVEVVATGTLHSDLGLYTLLAIYLSTTGIGAAVLFTQLKTMKAISQRLSRKPLINEVQDNLEAQREGAEPTEKAREWSYLAFQGAIYTFAWVLVLIPGLVTDIAGFGFIGAWFARKSDASQMLLTPEEKN